MKKSRVGHENKEEERKEGEKKKKLVSYQRFIVHTNRLGIEVPPR